jgi:hypothetical protein
MVLKMAATLELTTTLEMATLEVGLAAKLKAK